MNVTENVGVIQSKPDVGANDANKDVCSIGLCHGVHRTLVAPGAPNSCTMAAPVPLLTLVHHTLQRKCFQRRKRNLLFSGYPTKVTLHFFALTILCLFSKSVITAREIKYMS